MARKTQATDIGIETQPLGMVQTQVIGLQYYDAAIDSCMEVALERP